MQAKEKEELIHFLPLAGVQSHTVKQSFSTCNIYLGMQKSLPWAPFFPLFQSLTSHIVDYPFGQLGSTVPAVFPYKPLPSQSVTLVVPQQKAGK